MEELNFNETFDYVFSLGVLHHIPNAEVVMKNIHKSLKSGGNFIFWVYGYEGNKIYIIIFNNLRRITRILPDSILRIFCNLFLIYDTFYVFFISNNILIYINNYIEFNFLFNIFFMFINSYYFLNNKIFNKYFSFN